MSAPNTSQEIPLAAVYAGTCRIDSPLLDRPITKQNNPVMSTINREDIMEQAESCVLTNYELKFSAVAMKT